MSQQIFKVQNTAKLLLTDDVSPMRTPRKQEQGITSPKYDLPAEDEKLAQTQQSSQYQTKFVNSRNLSNFKHKPDSTTAGKVQTLYSLKESK